MPYENEIKNKKLIIIPDGKLNYIAFDALITELPDTSTNINFKQLKYLIKSNTINYSYSANLLFIFNDSKATVSNSILAFAPEYQITDSIDFNNQRMALMPLEGIKEEVELINNVMKKVKKFTGFEATEMNFRKEYENFDILHLAMHAIIDDNNPAYSSLAFTQPGIASDSFENNGWLNTADIYNLDLNARLTVLSACNTGSGTLRKGEGVMSLARGFLYAGCPSIVMSLWEVEDNAGTEIIGSFYKFLKRGRSIDESIRLSKLNYLENSNPRTAHPHYWLGYVTIGDNSPLYRSYDFYFFGILMIVLLAVTIDQLIRTGKFRKKRTMKK
jgi:CHAT domain-containing protein